MPAAQHGLTASRAFVFLLALCGLFLSPTGAAPPPDQTAVDPTIEKILRRGPRTPNPALSFLPAGVEGDWEYWRPRMALDAAERRRRQDGICADTVTEAETAGLLGLNDLPILGESLPPTGSGPGERSCLVIRGALRLPPEDRAPALEPDTSIPDARTLPLTPGIVARVAGTIGDGNAPRADFDFFRITATAGQRLQITVRTPDPTGDLDPIVAVFDSAGGFVQANDNRPVQGLLLDRDSLLETTVPSSGDYYVVVGGFNPVGGGDLRPQFPADPFDGATAPPPGSLGEYTVAVGVEVPSSSDRDFFQLQLRAGDVFGARVDGGALGLLLAPVRGDDDAPRIGTRGGNLSAIHPDVSPLPMGGRAAIAAVVEESGLYALGVDFGPDFDLSTYEAEIFVSRPLLETSSVPRRQILFLDFDGATVDPAIFSFPPGPADLSPLAAFLEAWGLASSDEDAVIDAVVAVVEENLREDLFATGNNPTFDLEILNSRDHADPFGQPDVSRVVVGGTIQELGIGTIGIAESVDVGNFALEETAVVLLDLLSAEAPNRNSLNSVERADGATMLDLIGAGVGAIAAHEAGHFFANFHTARDVGPENVMDRGGNLLRFVGTGPDEVFGTADDVDVDFGPDDYEPNEAFTGVEDTLRSISFDLDTGGERARLTATPPQADFGTLPVGDEASVVLTVGNGGSRPLTVARIALEAPTDPTHPGGPTLPPETFRLATPFSPFTLEAGETRSVTVVFAPPQEGRASTGLRIRADGDSEQPVLRLPLTGFGGVPSSDLLPSSHDFGVVEYSEADPSRSFTFELRNAGPGPLEVFEPLLVGQGPEHFSISLPEAAVVPAGGALVLPARFQPAGAVGDLSATAVLRTNDPLRPLHLLELRGRANGPDLDFRPILGLLFSPTRPNTTQSRILTVENLGNRDLIITGADLVGPDPGEFELTPVALPVTLPPGADQRFTVTFRPTSLGEKEAFLRLANNDPDEAPLEVLLAGPGAEQDIAVAPDAGDFGAVRPGNAVNRFVEILNEGLFRLRVSATVVEGPDASAFQITSGGAPFSVSREGAWPVGMRFRPNEERPFEASLRVESDDPDEPTLIVPLRGLGALPALGLDKSCSVGAAQLEVFCRIVVTSLGPGTAPGVRVEDPLPPELIWIEDSCSAGPPAADGSWIWLPGVMPEGSSSECELRLAVAVEPPALFVNRANARTALQASGMPVATAEATIELRPPAEIPTLSPFGFIVLVLSLISCAAAILRCRRRSRCV